MPAKTLTKTVVDDSINLGIGAVWTAVSAYRNPERRIKAAGRAPLVSLTASVVSVVAWKLVDKYCADSENENVKAVYDALAEGAEAAKRPAGLGVIALGYASALSAPILARKILDVEKVSARRAVAYSCLVTLPLAAQKPLIWMATHPEEAKALKARIKSKIKRG